MNPLGRCEFVAWTTLWWRTDRDRMVCAFLCGDAPYLEHAIDLDFETAFPA